jgi:hypothetical protein
MPAMDDDSPAPSSLASSPASSDRDAGQEHTLVVPARVTNVPSQSTLARSSPTPYSPSASVAMLRTAETLEGLAQQLTALDHSRLLESDPDLTARCCCGAVTDCPTLAARDRVDSKLKLSGGEIQSACDADKVDADMLPPQRSARRCSTATKHWNRSTSGRNNR